MIEALFYMGDPIISTLNGPPVVPTHFSAFIIMLILIGSYSEQ